jgi:phosphatidylglycerophosphate synthase
MRIIIVLLLLAIIFNMARALVFIFRNQGKERERGVRALTIRIGLSFAVLILLAVGSHFGWIDGKL